MSEFVSNYKLRRPVGAKSIESILGALRSTPDALTIPQLQALTGKSYPTIKFALEQSGAQRVPNVYPAKFLPPEAVVTVLGKTYEHVADRIIIDLRKDDVALNWNGSADRVGNQIKDLEISRHSNPNQLLEKFTNAASLFATIAHEIELVASKPDWFDMLMEVRNDDERGGKATTTTD